MLNFEKSLNSFVDGCQAKINQYYIDQKYSMEVPQVSIGGGRKYIKIVRVDNQTSIHCFVNTENGDVLKAASWKAPAKHARGNIYNEDNGLNCMSQFGAAYMRG